LFDNPPYAPQHRIEFLGIWEQLNNPDFKPIEFDGFRKQAGLNSFVLTSKRWIDQTGAIGLVSKAGRYGGTYAHKDIAFEFASWISVEFKLYLIKEFQRLKEEENRSLSLEWSTCPFSSHARISAAQLYSSLRMPYFLILR
jgi:KilA-N domain